MRISHVLNILGKPREALEQINKALELDPFNPLYLGLYGMNLMYAREFDFGIKKLENALVTFPDDPVALSTLRTAFHVKGEYDKAIEIWIASYAANADSQAVNIISHTYTEAGYHAALSALAQLMEERSKTSYITPYRIGTLYTRAGEKEKAIAWLEKAYEAHDSNMPYIGVDPIFDILVGEEGYELLLQKMNLVKQGPFAKTHSEL